jgi:hypothetical protein
MNSWSASPLGSSQYWNTPTCWSSLSPPFVDQCVSTTWVPSGNSPLSSSSADVHGAAMNLNLRLSLSDRNLSAIPSMVLSASGSSAIDSSYQRTV